MGEDPSTKGAEVTADNDPAEIREQIEATREELGETVAALAMKADVKSQAKQRIDAVKAALSTKKDDLVGKARQASPDEAVTATSRASEEARQNPLPVAA